MKIKRISKWIFLVLLLFLVFSLFGDQGFIALYKHHQQNRKLSSQIKQSHRVIDSLKTEIERLKNDTVYIEKIAREKLGMARRDEKIYKFIKEDD
ncbi:MAG: septum formation initiator family protein [Fibrobacter sp.]|jgi:cell division protein FtsB|nr:septum formation initiator family protein [Fibrobacter sp.]HON11316.1 septum formation initiator family protein [Chitinispirillaceae bacterium]